MHNHQHNLKTHNMSKLLVIGLSIILLTGISLVPTLQIETGSPTVTSTANTRTSPPAASPAPPTPEYPSSDPPAARSEVPSAGGSPSSGTAPAAASEVPEYHKGATDCCTRRSSIIRGFTTTSFGYSRCGEAANQTSGEGGGAVNQSAMVLIPQRPCK